MGFCLLVPLPSSGRQAQMTHGQVLPRGRDQAASRWAGFPFIVYHSRGEMCEHHLWWESSLHAHSTAESCCCLDQGRGVQVSPWHGQGPFHPCSPPGGPNPPSSSSPALTVPGCCPKASCPCAAPSTDLPSQSCRAPSLLHHTSSASCSPPTSFMLGENNRRGKSQANTTRAGNTGRASLPQLLPKHLEALPARQPSFPKARSFLSCLRDTFFPCDTWWMNGLGSLCFLTPRDWLRCWFTPSR